MRKRQKIVLGTLFLALLVLGAGIFYKQVRLPVVVQLEVKNQPSIGDGPIQFVLFEDLLCDNCRIFTEKIFPQVFSTYIETGIAEIFFIPVAFSDHSRVFANAALSVYNIARSRFVPFVLELAHGDASAEKDILAVAEKIGGIDLEVFQKDMEQGKYFEQIEQNLIYARKLIGPDFGTPMLFVNGVKTSTTSFNAISKEI